MNADRNAPRMRPACDAHMPEEKRREEKRSLLTLVPTGSTTSPITKLIEQLCSLCETAHDATPDGRVDHRSGGGS